MGQRKESRKDFLIKSSMGLAGAALLPNLTQATVQVNADSMRKKNQPTISPSSLILKNVRLETGFEYEEGQVIGTQTALFTVELANGKIKSILPNNVNREGIDALGRLMLPSFADMHIHLDKTYYGDRWQATRPRKNGVKGMIALEKEIIPELLKKSTYKAERLIELLQSNGTTYARSHVNIEPTSKFQSLNNLQKALENKIQSFGSELVAFPQHGLYYTDTVPYMKDVAKMGIHYIGGLDPYTIDGAIERPIDFTLQLALDHKKGVDIHLHESGESGTKTIDYLIKKVLENPSLKGKTYISHAFALSQMESTKLESTVEGLATAGIGIVSSVPIGRNMMPIPTLLQHGVRVVVGTDSVVDHWNTFGSGSVLQKANLVAQLYGMSSEFALSRALRLATAGPIPLDDQGVQQWPKVGDVANLVFVDATCSAEAVSRISTVRSLYYEGNQVF